MNRCQELKEGKTKMAILGLDQDAFDIALDFAQYYTILIGDNTRTNNVDLDTFISRKGFYELELESRKLEFAASEAELRSAGIYYLNGITSSVMDWGCIKETTALIGRTLSAGDWVIFGSHIDPDIAEVVLIDILESRSGLSLGEGFEIAFSPSIIGKVNFDNMSNEMKLSHNLIITEVEKIFNTKAGGEFGSNQITYRDPKQELNAIKAKIVELWVPMLNEMTPGTFKEFVKLTMNKGFLDAYNHLKLSNETKVDWRRFFRLALRNGLNQDLTEIQNGEVLKLAI